MIHEFRKVGGFLFGMKLSVDLQRTVQPCYGGGRAVIRETYCRAPAIKRSRVATLKCNPTKSARRQSSYLPPTGFENRLLDFDTCDDNPGLADQRISANACKIDTGEDTVRYNAPIQTH